MTNKEAISKLRQMKNYYHFESFAKDNEYKIEALELAIKALENERPQGEWVDTNEAYIVNENGERVPNSGISECSVCKQRVAPLFMGVRNFCPNCGADMRGGNQ